MSFPPGPGLAGTVNAIAGGQISGQVRLRRANARRAEVLALLIAGMSRAEIGRRLGVSPRTVAGDLAMLQDERVQVADIIEEAGLDADDVHITLSKMHDADISEIMEFEPCLDHGKDTACACTPVELRKWTGYYLAPHRWPEIWRCGLAGKIKTTRVPIPDGQRTPGGDQVAYRVEIERESLLKILDLASRLRAVDALVQQKAGDVNVLVVTADRARQVQSARKRLEKVIDLPAVPQVTDTTGAGWLPPEGKT
jgi:hypothetical protein